MNNIQYKQWVSVDRSTLETIIKSADDFVDSFCDQIRLLIPHSFVAKQQSLFQTDAMSSLLPGQFLVIGDFSEKCSPRVPLEQLTSNNTPICCILATKSQESWNMSAMLLYLIACITTQSLYIYSRRT